MPLRASLFSQASLGIYTCVQTSASQQASLHSPQASPNGLFTEDTLASNKLRDGQGDGGAVAAVEAVVMLLVEVTVAAAPLLVVMLLSLLESQIFLGRGSHIWEKFLHKLCTPHDVVSSIWGLGDESESCHVLAQRRPSQASLTTLAVASPHSGRSSPLFCSTRGYICTAPWGRNSRLSLNFRWLGDV